MKKPETVSENLFRKIELTNMKKLLILFTIVVLATGCGQHEEPRTDLPAQNSTSVK
jgi:hypothetical protein